MSIKKAALYYRTTSVLICALFVVSCTQSKDTAFTRMEKFFSNDSLKHAIAEFYSKYACYHHGISRTLVDSLGNPTDINYKSFDNDTLFYEYLERNSYKYIEDPPIADEIAMTDEDLKQRIIASADLRHRPWCKDIEWKDFCRYVLPYRNGDEALSNWYLEFRNKYLNSIIDSVPNPSSIRDVTNYLIRCLQQEVKYGTRLGYFYNFQFLTPEEMERMHTLECKALAHYGTLALRSCGIPCVMIEIHWRFTEIVHSSILIPAVGSNKMAYRLSIYDEPQDMGLPKDSMASWRTWSYEFMPNPDLEELTKDKNIPNSFVLPITRHDITPLISRTQSIHRRIPDSLMSLQHLFLCRFHNWEWYPIREGKIENGYVLFKNATIRQWYRLGYMDYGKVKTFGETFTIMGNGEIKSYNSEGDTVIYKLIYNCDPTENRETCYVTSYYWTRVPNSMHYGWMPITGNAVLWGFNESTGEYKIFHESMRNDYKPVFHLQEVHLPQWTVFTNDRMPRPLGYLTTDSITNEGYFIQF